MIFYISPELFLHFLFCSFFLFRSITHISFYHNHFDMVIEFVTPIIERFLLFRPGHIYIDACLLNPVCSS